MEINREQPPLVWPQFESTGYNRRRSPVPTIFGPAMVAAISAVLFLLFVIFVVPPFLSITSQILQPASVKRGWDSINVVLVVFAILCGVLARRNDDGLSLSSPSSHGVEEEGAVVTSGEMTVGEVSEISSQQWFDDVYDADRLKIYESLGSRSFSPGLPVTGTAPLRRSSSSYPDLRNGISRETVDRRFRFYDDFELDKYRSFDSRSLEQIPNLSKIEIIEESEPKEILVDKFVVRPSSPPPPQQPPAPPPPPPPPPPPVEVLQKPRRTHRSVRSRDKHENSKRSEINSDSTRFKRAFQPPPSPPPPPPPPPFTTATPPRKQGSLQRRKSNAAKEIKMVFASLYNQGKRKKKVLKSKRKEITESPVVVTVTGPLQYQSMIPPPSPPPPRPPPPPPQRSSQSVFYGLFKKGVKSKKIHSIPAPPPPPPPRKIQLDPRRVKPGRPPRPAKPTNFNEESYVHNGQRSPLIQITPPPPPPPPFRVPPLKFVVSGDFAKIRSNQSSRCSSPEREVIDLGWGLELTQADGGVERSVAVSSSGGPGFCPSPDVNTKADNFIARLRDEWRLDKMNSVKGKRNLGSV